MAKPELSLENKWVASIGMARSADVESAKVGATLLACSKIATNEKAVKCKLDNEIIYENDVF